MSQPDNLPTLFDTGNALLQTNVPAALMTGKVPTPDGERGIATIRTTSATVTITLTREDAQSWAQNFAEMAAALSGSGLVIPKGAQAAALADAARRNSNGSGPHQLPGRP